MEIVVNISEDIYKRILPYKDEPIISNHANYLPELTHAVANGTPLPKEHGDLIDISKLPVTYAYLGISDKPTSVVNYNCILNAKKIIRGR